jgi:hypothetical protein
VTFILRRLNAMKRRRLFTDLCGGIVDISNETLVTSSIKQDIQYGQKLCSYYSIFGNTMEAIARNSGAEVVENMGGEVIFFFPKHLIQIRHLSKMF